MNRKENITLSLTLTSNEDGKKLEACRFSASVVPPRCMQRSFSETDHFIVSSANVFPFGAICSRFQKMTFDSSTRVSGQKKA